jgi:flagellar biosynthesis protein FliR
MMGAGIELEGGLQAFMLGTARVVPIAWMLPVFGGPSAPAPLRLAIGASMALLFMPRILAVTPLHVGPLMAALLLAREVFVGVTLGFVAGCFFRAADAAGRLVDGVRGAGFAEVLSPVSPERSSPLGTLYQLLAIVIFLRLSGPAHLVAALDRSYEALPLAPSPLPDRLAGVAALAGAASGKLLASAVGLAAPALVAMLLADLALGVLGRFAPQVPLYFAGMPLKALVGVGVVLLGLGALHGALSGDLPAWAALLGRAAAIWR